MTQAAMKGGRALNRDFGEVQNLQVSIKGPGDFVTSADKKAEKIIRAELEKARPDFGFLMEEGGEIIGRDPQNRWIVDPLDGTLNFLHGLPHYSVSIGLEREGEVVAGVIYNPLSDELFVAEQGQGAYFNDKRMRVAARRDLADCMIATVIPHFGKKDHATFIAEETRIMRHAGAIRSTGSTALDLAYIAAGQLDGCWERGIEAWDVAAGMIIMQEAGGFITDFDGGKNLYSTHTVIAGNPQIHGALLELVNRDTDS